MKPKTIISLLRGIFLLVILFALTSPGLTQNRKAEFDSLRTFYHDLKGGTFQLSFDAIACYSPSDSGATLDTLQNMTEFFSFSSSADNLVILEFITFADTTRIDSMTLFASTPDNIGNSAFFKIEYEILDVGDDMNAAFSFDGSWILNTPFSATADVRNALTATLSPSEEIVGSRTRLRWRIKRDQDNVNDTLTDIARLHSIVFHGTYRSPE